MTSQTATAAVSQSDYLDWSHVLWDYPEIWIEECFGVKPEPSQQDLIRLMPKMDPVQIAIKACHGPGKTAGLVFCGLWWLLAHPHSKIGATAPTQHQLHDVLWPEYNKWIATSKWELWRYIEWKKTRIEVREAPERWFATQIVGRLVKTASDIQEAPSLQGLHAEAVMWQVDEASGVPDAVFGAIKGSMSQARFRKTIAVGNPNTPHGVWYRAFHRDRKYWWTQTIKYTDIVRNSEAVQAWGDELIEQYGPDHPWVRVKVLGEFPHQSEYGLIPLWAWERASTDEHQDKLLSAQEYKGRTIGVDVADTGSNKHMMACAEGSVVVELEEIRKPSIDDLADATMDKIVAHAVMDKVIEFQATTVVLDKDGGYANGVITVLRDILSEQKRHDVKIIAKRGSNSAKDDQRFANARAELHWAMKDAVEAGEVAVPDNDQAIIQATTIRWKRQEKGGRIVIWSKEQMKNKLGLESPDEWDAILLALTPALLGHVHVPASSETDKQPRIPRRQRTTASGFC